MRYILIILIILLPAISLAQWNCESKTDEWSGTRRYAIAIGTSDDTAYNEPTLSVDKNEEVLKSVCRLTNIGDKCRKIKIRLQFDNSPDIYTNARKCNYSNKTQEIIFPYSFKNKEEECINLPCIYEYMKIHRVLHIRVSDECSIRNYEFSLSGFPQALNYVLK